MTVNIDGVEYVPVDADPMHIAIVVDSSGSMTFMRDEAKDVINEYLKSQTEGLVTLVKLSGRGVDVVLDKMPVADARMRSFIPYGGTPLNDAVGQTINRLSGKTRVMFVILTDGLENTSQEFTTPQIKALVEQKQADGWGFVWLSAGIEAWDSHVAYGVHANSARDSSGIGGLKTMSAHVGTATMSYVAGEGASFTAEQKATAKDESD